MYVELIKPYEYTLDCGMVFRSHTPSVGDDEGLHHFPCRRCKVWHEYKVEQMQELKRSPASARDLRHVEKLDKAILKDRIVQDLRAAWDEGTYKEIAERHGSSLRTVERIAAELGVSDYGGGGAKVLTHADGG